MKCWCLPNYMGPISKTMEDDFFLYNGDSCIVGIERFIAHGEFEEPCMHLLIGKVECMRKIEKKQMSFIGCEKVALG